MKVAGLEAVILLGIAALTHPAAAQESRSGKDLPRNLAAVLEAARPLKLPRRGRLPLLVLPIKGTLEGMPDAQCEGLLRALDARGIAYIADWRASQADSALSEALRIARIQKRLRLEVVADATGLLYGFFDGSPETLHVDARGRPFADTSFGRPLGCPFALESRLETIRSRVERFARAYREAAVPLDMVFADWEIDGPLEWNGAWESAKRCRRCRGNIPRIEDFRSFQGAVRRIRAELQRRSFAEVVKAHFPQVLVGNYAVYPQGRWRYWYDYFERLPEGAPYRADRGARYREWYPEFPHSGYTMAMPVVYTWYPIFSWYDFDDPDYRWVYNLLLVASNAGRHTPPSVPLVPFVHWHTTAPPAKPDPSVRQLSPHAYKEVLWHLLLRGHDTFFLWCTAEELEEEIRLVHEVYAESLAFSGFLERGTPVSFAVPRHPGPVVSGLAWGGRVLARRTDFGRSAGPIVIPLDARSEIALEPGGGLQVVRPRSRKHHAGAIRIRGEVRFPLGFYDLPPGVGLEEAAQWGVNLVRCRTRDDLDRAGGAGLAGWVPLPLERGPTGELRRRVESLAAHPALSVWEGPDEVVWNFTAYSGLARTAGFSRADWRAQKPEAVAYARKEAARILARLRDAAALVREADPLSRPLWINEAADSDVRYVREYLDATDITGCDYYPVREGVFDLQAVGRATERWKAIGQGKPVWMVLQGFSWHRVRPERGRRYPTFAESRFMAWEAIVHGARGLLWWGAGTIDDPDFARSLLALTAELSRLEAFLLAPEDPDFRVTAIDEIFDPPGRGVRGSARRAGDDLLVILVNEDPRPHLGVEAAGLDAFENRRLDLLYGDDSVTVRRGAFVTRIGPYGVQLWASGRSWETDRREGRDYPSTP